MRLRNNNVVRHRALSLVLALVSIGLSGCAPDDAKVVSAGPASTIDLTQLTSRIWQITQAPSKPPRGSIYIFLANGTLLETSCVETYRIAAWTIDPKAPSVLRVVEDERLAFTAVIATLTPDTLRLRQTLTRSSENRDLTLKAVEREFVCPDMPK